MEGELQWRAMGRAQLMAGILRQKAEILAVGKSGSFLRLGNYSLEKNGPEEGSALWCLLQGLSSRAVPKVEF